MNIQPHVTRRSALLGLLLTAVMTAVPIYAADITFFAYSDCHYGAGHTHDKPVRSRAQVQWINELPGKSWPESIGGVVEKPLGIIMAGDLIDNGAVPSLHPREWSDYVSEFGVNGEGRVNFPVYEGLGNHDWNPDRVVFKHLKQRNKKRLELGHIDHVSDNGYHYSWDWDGIHYVQVNIFPGNEWHGEADTYGPDAHNPELARDFLKKDLEENIGDSGRPVIIIYHFRPVDENWWTYSAMDKFHRIIQDYNVVLLMVGHQGGGLNNKWRGINWASSNGVLQAFRITPDNKLVAAAYKAGEWGEKMSKKIFLSYKDSGLPAVVNNGEWATDVTTSRADLSGKLLYQATPKTEVTVYWGTEDGGDNPDQWEHSQAIGVQKPGESFKTQISNLKPWTTYYYRCRASNSEGEAWAATSIPFHTRGLLPTGWDTEFLGYEQRPWGGAHMEGQLLTVRGSGRDVGERGQSIDNFQYAFTKATGNVEVVARIEEMQGKTRSPKAGVMIRSTVDAGSPNVSLLWAKREGVRLMARADLNGRTEMSKGTEQVEPAWLKLVRKGDVFTGFMSADGESWTQVGEPVQVPLKPQLLAGLAVTAGNRDGSRHQAVTFSNVTAKTQP